MSATPWKYDERFGCIVDAGEGVVCQFWGKAEELFHNSVENGLLVEHAVNALPALLAVAKAAATADLDHFSPERIWDLSCRLVDLEVSHPGWREWQP